MHVLDANPLIRDRVDKYLQSIGLPYGSSTELEVEPGYKLAKYTERWKVKGKSIIRVIERGVVSDDQYRKLANAIFYMRVNEALPINTIYLAGKGASFEREPESEKRLANRLMSYLDIRSQTDHEYKAFCWQCENTKREIMLCK